MKRINVTIRGMSPLLMNSPKSMIEDAISQDGSISTPTKKRDYEAQAKKLAYITDKGQ